MRLGQTAVSAGHNGRLPLFATNGDHLATIRTSNPFAEIGELAVYHGVDADEIKWRETAVCCHFCHVIVLDCVVLLAQPVPRRPDDPIEDTCQFFLETAVLEKRPKETQ